MPAVLPTDSPNIATAEIVESFGAILKARGISCLVVTAEARNNQLAVAVASNSNAEGTRQMAGWFASNWQQLIPGVAPSAAPRIIT